jgi:Flp pilus assembly protein TadB
VHLLDAQRAEAASSDTLDPITPHEDVERQPDGVPHLVIGLTALFSVAIAALVIGVFHSGATLGSGAAILIAFVGVPLLVFRLGAKADRDRDHDHPSR